MLEQRQVQTQMMTLNQRQALEVLAMNTVELREFLEQNGSEGRNMVLTEWDENEARRVAAEEAREETREKIMKEEREARRIAIEETREKVMKEERQNTVRSMKEQGLPEELIARVVKLPVEQVKKILEA